MITSFKKKTHPVDVLVVVVGHNQPDFLSDTAQSFDHYNRDSLATYRLAFAIDNNRDCADVLASQYGDQFVYCSAKKNGWGRGILRTLAHSLDHFHRNGLRWKHLITIDSDALVVGRCLDQYVSLVEPGVFFVGQKWGGEGPYDASNPGPTIAGQRRIKYLAKLGLFAEKWTVPDYMVAGPFVLWTEECLKFMEKIGLLPGPALDQIYRYILFPHDQITSFILGIEGHEFRSAGSASMLYCGEVGGEDSWKGGFPTKHIEPFGRLPVFPENVVVIHPIRSKNLEEGKVRSYFRKLRNNDLSSSELWGVAAWNGYRLPVASWD